MNVSELFELTHWIEREISRTQVPQRYQELFSVLQANVQPNQAKQPFETQKDNLIGVLSAVPLDSLTKDQLAFLDRLNILGALGKQGVALVEDILYRNVIDIATSAEKIQTILSNLNSGIQKATQIATGLSGCVDQEEAIADEVMIRIGFTGHAAMANIVDFKSWGNIWYDIGRGITMAHGASPEDVKIVGATKGSIIIELAVVYAIAKTTADIIVAALNVADRVLGIKKQAEEIRQLKLSNTKLAKSLEDEAEKEKVAGISKITNDIAITLNINQNGEGDKIVFLDKAVKNLVNFIEKGGEVDFVLPEDDGAVAETEEDEQRSAQQKELRAAFSEIRHLERKVALLAHTHEENAEETE